MSVFTVVWALGLGSSSAWGANAEVCFAHKVDFSHDPDLDQDYLTEDGIYPAWGAKVVIDCEDCSGPDPEVWSGYLSTDPDESCVSLPLVQYFNPVGEKLSTAHTYEVKLKSRYQINGHVLKVTPSPLSSNVYASTKSGVQFVYPFPATGTTRKLLRTNINSMWNIATVASWVLLQYGDEIPTTYYESDGSLGTAPPFIIANQGCGDALGYFSCTDEGVVSIDAFGSDDERRYVVAHEFGHAISYRAAERSYLGVGIPDVLPYGQYEWWDYDAPEGGCFSGYEFHDMTSKEYHNAAYVEGFGNFVAGLAMNDPEEFGGDAEITSHVELDWNYDINNDTNLVDVQDRLHSSLDLLAPEFSAYGNYDHLTTAINETNQCSGVRVGRATEYDYTRFLWDLYRLSAFDLTTLLDVFEHSEPDKWYDEAGLPVTDPEHPVSLLQSAADAEGVGVNWYAYAVLHGVAE